MTETKQPSTEELAQKELSSPATPNFETCAAVRKHASHPLDMSPCGGCVHCKRNAYRMHLERAMLYYRDRADELQRRIDSAPHSTDCRFLTYLQANGDPCEAPRCDCFKADEPGRDRAEPE